MKTATINAPGYPKLEIDKILYKERDGIPYPEGKLERRIVSNLIAHLESRGFKVFETWDREEANKVSTAKEAMEFVFNLDEVFLHFKSKAGKMRYVYLVLGNGIDIVSDWGIPKEIDGFDAAMNEFNAEDFA